MRDRWTPSIARSKRDSATKSRSETASSEFSKRPWNPSSAATEVGVEGQRGAGQRPGAQRRDVEPVHRREEPVDVARQRPAVRQEVVGQQHRLGPLQVGVAGQVHVARLAGPLGQGVLERQHVLGDVDQRPAAPQAQRGRHLVVAAPAGVQLGPHVAGQLGHPALDRRVHVLVAGGEDEGAAGQLVLDGVEGVEELGHLVVAEDARLAQALHVGARPGQVVGGQGAVEGQAHREVRHRVGHPGRDPALPQRHAPPPPASRSGGFVAAAGPRPAPAATTTLPHPGPTGARTPRRRRGGRCRRRRRWPGRGRRGPPGCAGRRRCTCPVPRSAGAPRPSRGAGSR